jgi:uncharacterized pyridoxamine 5'-phosphate oxidase family protein
MNKSEILGFLNANPVFHLATVEGNKPHARGMLMYRADENGILFHTGKTSEASPDIYPFFDNFY